MKLMKFNNNNNNNNNNYIFFFFFLVFLFECVVTDLCNVIYVDKILLVATTKLGAKKRCFKVVLYPNILGKKIFFYVKMVIIVIIVIFHIIH